TGFLNVNASDIGLPGTFDKVINWDADLTGTGKFLAFATSAADGSRVHIVEIPVSFDTVE
ncbi:hypothetical protein KC640_02045, partial [Candidatus Dojkabacteria bacterium]|nr:hypothetical protein [Candidatus Dojkabacteria bacterium]